MEAAFGAARTALGAAALLAHPQQDQELALMVDSSKFYYCEKSENLHSCSLLCWLSHGKTSKP
jgi:hypothetical protein